MIVGRVVGAVFSFSRSVCMSVYSAGISRVLIKYSGKYVKIYFNMKITYTYMNTYILPPACPTFYVLFGMTRKGCVKVGLPVKGVSSGRVGS